MSARAGWAAAVAACGTAGILCARGDGKMTALALLMNVLVLLCVVVAVLTVTWAWVGAHLPLVGAIALGLGSLLLVFGTHCPSPRALRTCSGAA